MNPSRNRLSLTPYASPHPHDLRSPVSAGRIRVQRAAGLICCLLYGFLGTGQGRAASSYWNNVAGGSFQDPANWIGGVPGASDLAYYNSNANYQVTWSANVTNRWAYYNGGVVTQALGSAMWLITEGCVVGQGAGITSAVSHVSGTVVITNSQGTGILASGQSANRNFTLNGGTAIVDRLNFGDDGSAAWSRFLASGTLTTLHGANVSVGSDFVFWYLGGRVGTWNMLGGTHTVDTASGLDLYTQLGWAYDSQYIINVSGPTTVWNNYLHLVVGNTGAGHQVNISQGAQVASADTWIGRYGSSDVVTVNGANSVWNIRTNYFGNLQGYGQLFLSENASACGLVITNGGQVNCGLVTITRYTSGKGNFVVVSGDNSLWNVNANLVVGDYGTSNRVTIERGGRINCLIAYLGGSGSTTAAGAAMNNSMVIADANSVLNASSVQVGKFAGKCSLTVTNGGMVQCSGGGTIGSQSLATNNFVLITGTGSVWMNSTTVTVGSFGGSNSMTIANGGQVFNTRGIIGNGSASNLVVVTGTGSLWSNSTDVYVGNSANALGNQLLVSNSGTVQTTNLVAGVTASSLNNAITVAGGNIVATNAALLGAVDVRRGTLNLLSGRVQANRLLLTNGTSSRMNFNGGRFDAGNSTVSHGQPFAIGSGTDWACFNLAGGSHSFANGLIVSSNAWLTGGGTISGDVTSAGVLAPDVAFGSLNFSGNLQFQPNSDLAIGIGGYSPGFDSDYIWAGGSIVWNGRLHVTLAPGFVPNPFDVFTIAQCAGDSGSFVNVANGGRLATTDGLGSFVVTYGSALLQLSDYQTQTPGPNTLKLAAAKASPTSLTLQFPYAVGRNYHLWFSTNLTSWTELPVPGYVQPQPGVGQWTDDGSLEGSIPFSSQLPRFYRISVE